MRYYNFKGQSISRLGQGIMRMPTNEPDGTIDEEKALALIDHAYMNGINYFDTAFFYHSCHSEEFIGKALAKYPRDTWYLADKMPGNFMAYENGVYKLELGPFNLKDSTFNSLKEIFELQLKRCGVDYFDFYMLHNLAESTYDLYTSDEAGIVNYLIEEKNAGRIRHLGFSSHGRPETIEKFLKKYNCFEYVQIQLNYLDWTLQSAGEIYDILAKHNLPVIAMEPVRGGKLANPGEKQATILNAARPNYTPAAWAFRFLQALPNVAIVLSGMTTMEQLQENIEIFCKDDPISEAEKAVLQQVVESMADFVPCTSCRYCCAVCPRSLDIPMLISTFNEACVEVAWLVNTTMAELSNDEKPDACIGCGMCNPLCPQNIDIPKTLQRFVELLEENKQEDCEQGKR